MATGREYAVLFENGETRRVWANGQTNAWYICSQMWPGNTIKEIRALTSDQQLAVKIDKSMPNAL